MRAPAGEVSYRVGGVTFALHGPARLVDPARSGPLARFEVEGPDGDVRIEVMDLASRAVDDGRLLFDSGGIWRLHERAAGYRITCASEALGGTYRVADFSRDWREGVVATRALDPPPSPLEHPIHEMVTNALLSREGGVDLHGCGVIDPEGRGLLLAGSSGAGKTTSARLWIERTGVEVVSDDRVVVREAGGAFRIHGTPWHGEAELASPATAPLCAIFLLEQASENGLAPLPPADAVSRLFACAFPPFWDRTGLSRTFDTLARIVDRVPVRRFRFRKDASSVAFIRRALESIAPRRNHDPMLGGVADVSHEPPRPSFP